MANNGLEKKLKVIFTDAEVQPPESVWHAINSDLMADENKRLRTAARYYRRLAAACVLLMFMVGAVSFYFWRNSRRPAVANVSGRRAATGDKHDRHAAPGAAVQPPDVPANETHHDKENAAISSVQTREAGVNRENLRTQGSLSSDASGRKPPAESHAKSYSADKSEERSGASEGATPGIDDERHMGHEAPFLLASVAPVVPRLAVRFSIRPADSTHDETMIKPEVAASDRRWLSFGVSTGSYFPCYSPPVVSSAKIASPYNTSGNGHSSLGSAFSYTAMLAQRISPRWVITAGVSYLRERLGYTSTLVNSQSYTALASPYYSGTPVTSTTPYAINSVLEYVTVPVQAGYVMIDRRIRLQTNAGFAGDVFLRNSLEDETGHARGLSKGPGASSPYRSYNWEAIVGEEITYKFTRRYGLSVVPGMRYSFASALKNGADHPYVLDINFRLRYIF